MEAKTGNHVLPAEAIREAVAYWLDSHEVAECDGDTRLHPDPATHIPHISVPDGEDLSDLHDYNSGLGFQDDAEVDDQTVRTVPDNQTGRDGNIGQ